MKMAFPRSGATNVKPVKVADAALKFRYGLMVSSLADFVKQTKEKFSLGTNGSELRVVEECDGTLVNDERYFQHLPDHSRLVILGANEANAFLNTTSPGVSVHHDNAANSVTAMNVPLTGLRPRRVRTKYYKVADAKRSQRHGIVAAAGVAAFRSALVSTMGQAYENACIVLEDDGTIADDEAYFGSLADGTRILALLPDECWSPALPGVSADERIAVHKGEGDTTDFATTTRGDADEAAAVDNVKRALSSGSADAFNVHYLMCLSCEELDNIAELDSHMLEDKFGAARLRDIARLQRLCSELYMKKKSDAETLQLMQRMNS